MRSRLLTLVLAIVTGAVAVAVVYMYVRQVEEDSTAGLEARPVLIATRSWPAGTSGEEIGGTQGGFEPRDVPERYVTPGALADPSQLEGLVLSEDVAAGEQLSSMRFSSSAQDAFATRFPEGTQALSLPVEHVRGIAGHIAAGDRLNAFFTQDQGATRVIARDIPVVEMQPAPDGDPVGMSTMVLAVSESQASRLINSQERAGLWFTLITSTGSGS